MLSQEEIESFLEDMDEYEIVAAAAAAVPPETPQTPWQKSARMMSLASRTQVAMLRGWQRALTYSHW